MSENENKTVTNGEEKESFLKKVGNFFKNAWAKVKAIPWGQPVKPLIGWSVFGGVLAVSVILMLICWL